MFVANKYNKILVENDILHFVCLTETDFMMTQENVSICGSIWIFHSDFHMWVCGNSINFLSDVNSKVVLLKRSHSWTECLLSQDLCRSEK